MTRDRRLADTLPVEAEPQVDLFATDTVLGVTA
jgi:hypothetical protein